MSENLGSIEMEHRARDYKLEGDNLDNFYKIN